MGNIQGNNHSTTLSNSRIPKKKQGFTLLELMVAIAVVGILTAIALPSLNNFLVKMRVDNEITELQRLLLTARNMAINTGKNTTVCPLTAGVCTTACPPSDDDCSNNWENEISVFTNDSNVFATNGTFAAPDELIKIKDAIKSGDKLQFANASVIYAPTGQLITSNGTFNYCPKNETNESRGIDLSISGRSYVSSDIDNDDKDEDRDGNEIICI